MQTPTPTEDTKDSEKINEILQDLKKSEDEHTPEATQERRIVENFGQDQDLYILTNLSRPPEALSGQRTPNTKVAFRGPKGGLVYRPVIGTHKETGKIILGKPVRPSKAQMAQFRSTKFIKGCVQGCGNNI